MSRRALAAIGFLAVLLGAGAAQATVCIVAATASAFGIYDPTVSSPNDTTASVTVTCSNLLSTSVSYTIGLGPGGSGSVTARTMSGMSSLPYGLYLDSGHSQVWGDGSGGSEKTDSYTLDAVVPTVRSYTVYGEIPAHENVATGAYLDTVQVTVTY